MTILASKRPQTPRLDGLSRFTTAMGAAAIAISAAGLVHLNAGFAWSLEQQAFYAIVGGLTCWRLVR